MKRLALSLIALFLLIGDASAANRFWVGGTGTWDAADTTHWASTTGGAGGQSVPGASDAVTFDGSSGGGTATVNTTVDVVSLTMGAFTGTLDFAANDNNITLSSFSGTGTGTRTLNMGDGLWTITGSGSLWTIATATNLTFNPNGSTLAFTATTTGTRTMTSAALTYGIVTVSANTTGGAFVLAIGASTIGTMNVVAPNYINFQSGVTLTITNPISWLGSSSNQILLEATTTGTVSLITMGSGPSALSWIGIREITFLGGTTVAATNSFNFLRTSGITIAAPSGGATPCILGGWLLWRDLPNHINDNYPAWIDQAA